MPNIGQSSRCCRPMKRPTRDASRSDHPRRHQSSPTAHSPAEELAPGTRARVPAGSSVRKERPNMIASGTISSGAASRAAREICALLASETARRFARHALLHRRSSAGVRHRQPIVENPR